MDEQAAEIAFTVVTTTLIILVFGSLIIGLLLVGRNRRLKHKNDLLKVKADYQKEISKVQMEVIESTMNEISHQLHDDLGQMLAFSILQINNVKIKNKAVQREISKVRESVQNSMQSLRTIAATLNTEYITSFGFYEALDKLIVRVKKMSGLNITINTNYDVKFNTHANEVFFFRIVQELITNTLKHSEATEINLYIIEQNQLIIFVYSDNGKGIQNRTLDDLPSKNSLGFTNILKRAELMKGKVEIKDVLNGFQFMLSFENN